MKILASYGYESATLILENKYGWLVFLGAQKSNRI
jgi:hypothetical protein